MRDMMTAFEERMRDARQNRNNAFISFCPFEAPESEGEMAGAMISIKDNIAVKGQRLTCASRILSDYIAPYDATVVSRLKHKGALIIGKNNMDEFACGSSGESSAFGPTTNPLFEKLVPGGSSSGSAAAVAEGIADASIGSDTGGSVRCPSAFCSTVGLKPSYGLISRHGLVDLSMSLESPAPIVPWGKEELLALIMDAVSGRDGIDQTVQTNGTACTRNLDAISLEEVTIAVPENLLKFCTPTILHHFMRFLNFMKEKGARTTHVEMKSAGIALHAYYVIMYSEFASAMQRYDGLKFGSAQDGATLEERIRKSRGQFGKEVKRRILLGTYITSAEGRSEWYSRALSAREIVREELNEMASASDFIALPTMPVEPYGLGTKLNPVEMYATDIYTVPANLAGIPALSFPAAPGIGIQLMAKHGHDWRLISALKAIRKEGWKWRA